MVTSKNLSFDVLIQGDRIGAEGSFTLQGEEILFYSALDNLIKNAFEASPEKGRVKVDLSAEGRPEIKIHNQGLVPDEVRDVFFEKYTSSGKQDGTGLGTYVARLITETLGGEIFFESSRENGTTVTIVLPDRPDTKDLSAAPQ